jgi:hypothetical protein
MKKLIVLAIVVTALSMSVPVFAHHGDAGRYDENVVTLNGTVVELQMINPHSIVVIDVPDAGGKVTRWQAELGGPNALSRGFGWTRNTLKPGDKVTLMGRRVKSGAPYMNLTERAVVYLTDSKKLLFRTANADLPAGVVDPRPAEVQATPAGGEQPRPAAEPAAGRGY